MVKLDRKQQALIIFLVGVILFGGGYRLAQVKARASEENKPSLQRNPGEAAGEGKAKEFIVHVAGAVGKPGVYRLPQGARVVDALDRAGFLPDADTEALNLAALLTDGQKITVPFKVVLDSSGIAGAGTGGTQKNPGVFGPAPASAPATTGSRPSGNAPAGLVNINTADAGQLDTLPGIGPALAQRIMQYRELEGPFKSLEDLKNVSGIGDKKYESLKDRITL